MTVLFLNGAFGVGKTSVARRVVALAPRAHLLDPERLGWLLQRTRLVRGDYRGASRWQRGVQAELWTTRHVTGGPIIVPMCFSRPETLDAIATPIGERVVRVCLRATWSTVRERLERRGFSSARDRDWVLPRSEAFTSADPDPRLGDPLNTEGRDVDEIAREVFAYLLRPRRAPSR